MPRDASRGFSPMGAPLTGSAPLAADVEPSAADLPPPPPPTDGPLDVVTEPSRLPWVVAGLLALTTIVALVGWFGSGGDTDGSDARIAAIGFVTELTTWDAADGLDSTVTALRDRGTSAFVEQIDDVLGAEARATAEAVGASSQGEIVEVLLSEIDDAGDQPRVVAVVIVVQETTVADQSLREEKVSRLEMVQVDGQWLVDVVQILNAPQFAGIDPEVTP